MSADPLVLVLLIVSLLFNIMIAVVMVRTRETIEKKLDQLTQKSKRQDDDIRHLAQELLTRLPPMPYGVDIAERSMGLTRGPSDPRLT